jgi:aryl-alcohol dehydrogenase-like predicted oxidoreductase
MNITRVGVGAWAIGGGGWAFAWGDQDDSESIAAIRHAVERGINWVDTAAIYGLGHSEEVVRQALADIPASERPYVFTKCGLVWDEANRKAPARRIGAAASVRRGVEESLKRLGVERIDLMQMHWPAEDGSPVEEYWRTLTERGAARGCRGRRPCRHAAAAVFGGPPQRRRSGIAVVRRSRRRRHRL